MKNLFINPDTPTLSGVLESAKVDTVGLLDPVNVDTAKRTWIEFRRREGFKGGAKILTYPEGQLKLAKNAVFTLGLTLASADQAGFEACPWRGQCTSVCVLGHGKGSIPTVIRSRIARTKFAAQYPREFFTLVASEIDQARHKYKKVAVRLNVNSDVRFYLAVPAFFDGSLFGKRVVFYDYTKNPATLRGNGWITPYYRLTYSMHEGSNIAKVREFLSRGGTVAVVTDRSKGEEVLPMVSIDGELFATVDGDRHDNRYIDPAGVVVDLAAKGSARKNMGEFVQRFYQG